MRDPRFRLTPPSLLDVAASLALLLVLRWLFPAHVGDVPQLFAFWGIIFGAIVQALGWIGQQAATLAITAAQVAIWIGQAAWRLIQATGTAFGHVTGFLQSAWTNVIKPFVKAVWSDLQSAYRWVKRWADRAITAIEKIRARVMAIYDHWFRPVFDAIEATRKTLQLLAALHVPLAREIDRKLGEIEDRLLWPIQQIMLRLNQAIDWINRIVTFDGYLQRVTLLASLWRHAQESWSILLGPQLDGIDPADTARKRAMKYTPVDPAALARSTREYLETEGGQLVGVAAAALREWDWLASGA